MIPLIYFLEVGIGLSVYCRWVSTKIAIYIYLIEHVCEFWIQD